MKAGSFTLKDSTSAVQGIAKSLNNAGTGVTKDIERKVKLATQMVYQIAHQKRPYITNYQAKAEGRRLLSKGRYHRVSDPNAEAGVPVALINGGALQASLKTSFGYSNGKYQGRVYVDMPGAEYAAYLEFGTPNMQARPFMRPAVNLTKDAIKQMLSKK